MESRIIVSHNQKAMKMSLVRNVSEFQQEEMGYIKFVTIDKNAIFSLMIIYVLKYFVYALQFFSIIISSMKN